MLVSTAACTRLSSLVDRDRDRDRAFSHRWRCVPVLLSPKLLPLAKSAGLPLAMDLRGKFTGQPAVKIYDWARTTFFEKCSKHVIVWLGGACGDVIHPAVADWGVSQRAFVSDLVREIMRFRFDHRNAVELTRTATVCAGHAARRGCRPCGVRARGEPCGKPGPEHADATDCAGLALILQGL